MSARQQEGLVYTTLSSIVDTGKGSIDDKGK